MCAIAVLVRTTPTAQLRAEIQRMTEIVSHRGPDGYGAETWDDKIAFGHRRLAILGLNPAGHQPMERQGISITYNGEIYNYIELKAELASLGHKFVSQTDTEVLLAAYLEWGEECVKKLNGMWAFAIYDAHKKKLFASRDHFGIKPLYFWQDGRGNFAFGSEIKQFTVLPEWRASLNFDRARDYIAFGLTDHTAGTMFSQVTQIPAGHLLKMDLGVKLKPVIEPWYRPEILPFQGSFADAIQKVRALLEDSVRIRLRSDVAVGSCLSGGLDSSALVAAAVLARPGEKRFNTYSICWPNQPIDESRFIHEVENKTGVSGHHFTPTVEHLQDELREILWHQDEPFGSLSIFAQWSLFKMARESTTVILDGQGADELFLGYSSYFTARLASLVRQGEWEKFFTESAIQRRHLGTGRWKQFAQIANELLPESLKSAFKNLLGTGDFGVSLLNASGAENPFFSGGRRHDLYATSMGQVFHTNLPMLLHWEDRNSMAFSMESRLPFLDHRLMELALSLPDDYKLRGDVTKSVLREATRGWLPDSVIDRKDKIGFSTPEKAWATSSLRQWISEGTLRTVRKHKALFNSEASQLIEDSLKDSAVYHPAVWRVFCFGLWADRFQVEDAPC